VTSASRLVTRRRALLGAGALAIAACGPPKTAAPNRAAILDEQLRMTQIAAAAGASRARARVQLLEQAGAKATSVSPPHGADDAYAAENEALESYVVAIGELGDPASRKLLAELVSDAAASLAELARKVGRDPLSSAFPGQPS
jgi:hypothetical protein